MHRRVPVLMVLALAAAFTPARAEHESMPAWPPVGNAQPLGLAGTGRTLCGAQTLTAPPATVAVDLRDGRITGTVSATGQTVCSSDVLLRVSMTVAVYEDIGSGRLDLSTIGASDLTRLTLLKANTCTQTGNGPPRVVGCTLPLTSFTLLPGSRYVAVTGTTYEILDPRGGAWIFVPAPWCREGAVRSVAYCFLAADFRA